MTISMKAIDLILKFEGLDQPSVWPGLNSGISIGHGFDLGYNTVASLRRAWSKHLSVEELKALERAIGLRGEAAKAVAPRFRGIRVTKAAAGEVLFNYTLPEFERQTRAAFPGCELLPVDAYGALVSLVYNRGPGMVGTRRREMRAIRDVVKRFVSQDVPLYRTLGTIALQLRSMTRLWPKNSGLRSRREAEARLVEQAE